MRILQPAPTLPPSPTPPQHLCSPQLEDTCSTFILSHQRNPLSSSAGQLLPLPPLAARLLQEVKNAWNAPPSWAGPLSPLRSIPQTPAPLRNSQAPRARMKGRIRTKGRPAAGCLRLQAGSLPLALPAAGWRSLAPGTSPVRVNPMAHLSSCQPAVPAGEPHLGLRCLPAAGGQAWLRGVGKKGESQATNGVKMREQTRSRTGHPRGAAIPYLVGPEKQGVFTLKKHRALL